MAKQTNTNTNTNTSKVNTSKADKGKPVAKPVATADKGKGKQANANNSKAVGEPVVAAPRAFGLTGKGIRVLQLLARAKSGLTRKNLQAATGAKKGWSKLLGSHTVEGGGQSGDRCLAGQGLVEYVRDGLHFVYTITTKGKKALAAAVKPKGDK